jgi:diguanylate cyclase (GGDEF)-like protein
LGIIAAIKATQRRCRHCVETVHEAKALKILLVDDARSVSILLASRLNSYGHEVCIAENGQLAYDKFREFAPELVLMDIEMPVMNGFQATDRIRAFEASQPGAWTPIIFLTGANTTDNLVTAIEAGGDDLIAKNVPEAVLRAKMKAMSRVATLRQHLAAANQRLEELASRDGLTNLPNRRSMDSRTDAAWAVAQAQGKSFAILMVDIDNFKKYNDHYGHQAGDDCLRAIADAIATAVQDSAVDGAFAARYGGEEFAVVMPAASLQAYEQLAQAVVAAIRGCGIAHEKNADWGVVTASVGGAFLERTQGGLASLFRAADAQLYVAKEHGRNRAELLPSTR